MPEAASPGGPEASRQERRIDSYQPPVASEWLGTLLACSVRRYEYEPWRDELYRRYVSRGCTLWALVSFWIRLAEGLSSAIMHSLLLQLRSGSRTLAVTRVAGVPVTGLAATCLILTLTIQDCAWTGLAATLLEILR